MFKTQRRPSSLLWTLYPFTQAFVKRLAMPCVATAVILCLEPKSICEVESKIRRTVITAAATVKRPNFTAFSWHKAREDSSWTDLPGFYIGQPQLRVRFGFAIKIRVERQVGWFKSYFMVYGHDSPTAGAQSLTLSTAVNLTHWLRHMPFWWKVRFKLVHMSRPVHERQSTRRKALQRVSYSCSRQLPASDES